MKWAASREACGPRSGHLTTVVYLRLAGDRFRRYPAVGSSDLKGRNPPRAAIRGSSKPSTALDPSQRLKPTLNGRSLRHTAATAHAPKRTLPGLDRKVRLGLDAINHRLSATICSALMPDSRGSE